MIQKLISALILVPLAILFVVFAVANRQTVVVSFDPFDALQPMLSVAMPLFALILLLAVGGVVVGGVAAWLGQGKWRWRARHFEAEVRTLRDELDALRRHSASIHGAPIHGAPLERRSGIDAPRLTIPPPAA
jgi:uncharacterized integral membrane protein